MIQDHGEPDPAPSGERSLQPRPDPASMPAPLAAMAEALRANAEALHRLDSSQRRIAEQIEKTDRSQQVVASTRALNETFRGLSEIQRGLLDTLAGRKGEGGRVSPLLFTLVALLSGLLSVLVYDRWISTRTVPVSRYEEARRETELLRTDVEGLKARIADGLENDREAKRLLAQRDAAIVAAAGRGEALEARIEKLEEDLREKEARLENFLQVKAQADLAGTLQIQNMGLEREVRDLREKVETLERERANALEVFGEKLLDLRGVDPEELRSVARRLGVYEDPAPPPRPDGPVTLSRSMRSLLAGQINRLLPDAEESYDLIDVAAVVDGYRLRGVTLTRNRHRLLVNSLSCKEMVVHVDLEADTVELRLIDGAITNPARPGEEIPIGETGHSIFLTEVGAREWLRREGDRVAVDEAGRVVWRAASPS